MNEWINEKHKMSELTYSMCAREGLVRPQEEPSGCVAAVDYLW